MSQRRFRDFAYKCFFLGFWFTIFFYFFFFNEINVKAKNDLINPLVSTPAANFGKTNPKPAPGQEAGSSGAKPTLKEYQAYIKSIFGAKNWKLAFAVFENECNHGRREWPVCVNKWWDDKRNHGENSIGPAQINLLAHADKIPGATTREKELWLADWKNGIILAYKISDGGRNWNAWTAYTSGNYLKDL